MSARRKSNSLPSHGAGSLGFSKLWLALGALVLFGIAAFLMLGELESDIPNADRASRDGSATRRGSGADSGSGDFGLSGPEPSDRDKRLQAYRERRAEAERRAEQQGKSFLHVERILGDQHLDEAAAAKELLAIVQRTDLGVDERFEAMAHGLILEPKVFSELAANADLPAGLAGHLLDEFANLNGERELQVRACMALLGHHDAEITERCRELLSFYAGVDAQGALTDAQLVAAAEEYLKNLSEPATLDPAEEPAQEGMPDPGQALGSGAEPSAEGGEALED